jgi:hypothetical protein
MVSVAFRSGQVFDGVDCCPNPRPRIDRLVYRKQITIAEQQRLAQNVVTRQPIFVAQVSESLGSPNGAGTADNPFDSIAVASAAAGEHGIVFVRDGSFDESFALLNNQRLLADGFFDTSPHQVVTQLGTIQLPGQNTRASVVMPRINSSDRAGTIKLCQDDSLVDDIEIAGFTVTNSAGSGIFGVQNEGFSIHHNTLQQAAESGIALLNVSGTQFQNSTAPTSNNLISNNIIQNNQQHGAVLADVDLASLDLSSIGIDLNSKNISLANRGPLNVDIDNNTFTNNANDVNPLALSTQIQTQTNRDDHFGLYVAATTNATSTVNARNNTFTGNGAASALGLVDSTGAVGILAGGNSQIVASIEDSTFTGNFGVDIHGIVGKGPSTAATARLDLNVHRNLLADAQLAQTEDGFLSAGLRGVASTGFLNVNAASNVIQGSQSVLNAGLFTRMEAFYLASDGNAQITANLIDSGLNPLGRNGNEFLDWHIGIGADVEGTGITNLLVENAIVDAECVLKLHTGLDGVTATTGRLIADVNDSSLIVRLPSTSAVDGILLDAVGASQLTLNLSNVATRFEGVIPTVVPDRDWLNSRSADSSRITLSLVDVSPTSLMTGFQDFLEFRLFDESITTLTIDDSLIGQTQQFGIDIVAQDASRMMQTINNTSFGGNLLGLIDAEISNSSVLVSTINSSVFQSPSVGAIRLFAESNAITEMTRLGATFENNTFQIAPQNAVQVIGNSTSGNTIVRVNLVNNSADGDYLLQQMQSSGTTLFDQFSSGNTGSVIPTGTVTSSPTLLDIAFP